MRSVRLTKAASHCDLYMYLHKAPNKPLQNVATNLRCYNWHWPLFVYYTFESVFKSVTKPKFIFPTKRFFIKKKDKKLTEAHKT